MLAENRASTSLRRPALRRAAAPALPIRIAEPSTSTRLPAAVNCYAKTDTVWIGRHRHCARRLAVCCLKRPADRISKRARIDAFCVRPLASVGPSSASISAHCATVALWSRSTSTSKVAAIVASVASSFRANYVRTGSAGARQRLPVESAQQVCE